MAKSSKITLRFNARTRTNSRSARGSLLLPAAQTLQDLIPLFKSTTLEAARESVLDELEKAREDIKAQVNADLEAYTKRALAFFLNIDSPNTLSRGRAGRFTSKTITFTDRGADSQPYFNARNARVRMASTPNPSRTVTWAALAPSTIRRKKKAGKPALRFFYDTGALNNVLQQKLGQAFKDILSFDVQVKPDPAGGKRLVDVTIIPGRSVTKAGLAALVGPQFALGSTGNNRQIINFLQAANFSSRDELVRKLSNTGRSAPDEPRRERPFLQPVLGYWLIKRLPIIFAKAVVDNV